MRRNSLVHDARYAHNSLVRAICMNSLMQNAHDVQKLTHACYAHNSLVRDARDVHEELAVVTRLLSALVAAEGRGVRVVAHVQRVQHVIGEYYPAVGALRRRTPARRAPLFEILRRHHADIEAAFPPCLIRHLFLDIRRIQILRGGVISNVP